MTAQLSMFDPPAVASDPLDIDVRGFTFYRPWAEAIMRPLPVGATAPYPKRVDNRPPRSALASRVGKYIAIHTGRTIHADGLAWINATFGYGWTAADLAPAGVILGVARVVGIAPDPTVPWHFGATYNGKSNVGWLLDDVVTFATPVTGENGAMIDGSLGCWTLPDAVLTAVRERYRAALQGVGENRPPVGKIPNAGRVECPT